MLNCLVMRSIRPSCGERGRRGEPAAGVARTRRRLVFVVLWFSGSAKAQKNNDKRQRADNGEDGLCLVKQRRAAEPLPDHSQELAIGSMICISAWRWRRAGRERGLKAGRARRGRWWRGKDRRHKIVAA